MQNCHILRGYYYSHRLGVTFAKEPFEKYKQCPRNPHGFTEQRDRQINVVAQSRNYRQICIRE